MAMAKRLLALRASFFQLMNLRMVEKYSLSKGGNCDPGTFLVWRVSLSHRPLCLCQVLKSTPVKCDGYVDSYTTYENQYLTAGGQKRSGWGMLCALSCCAWPHDDMDQGCMSIAPK